MSALALALSGVTAVSASAASSVPAATKAGTANGKKGDIREPSAEMLKRTPTKKEIAALKAAMPKASRRAAMRTFAAAASKTPPVGTQRVYYVLDDYNGRYIAQTFTLRAVGQHIEAWVQDNLDYPAGDCRNDGNVNVVTDAQVQSLVDEFDTNMLPKESQFFSVAPDRDGSNSPLNTADDPDTAENEASQPFVGDGDKTLALISNVRDANYYAPSTPDGATYIAGFFSPTFNYFYDRNTMTIDSYDWAQRTGANPQPGTDGCGNALTPRPRLYEGTFAHEYQHLLESYASPGETSWMNEGLSDYAQTIVGYVDTTIPYGQTGADSHLNCFYGFSGTSSFPYCGAENSLTEWGDQGSPSILSDYGAAYSMITYIENRFGRDAITFLHNDADRNGLDSLQALLDSKKTHLSVSQFINQWAAMLAVDAFQDDGARLVLNGHYANHGWYGNDDDDRGKSKGHDEGHEKGHGEHHSTTNAYQASQLYAGIDWAWPGSYDSPGAPPNGSDYVQPTRGTKVLSARDLRSLYFKGDATYAPDPLGWTVDANAREGNAALYSGSGNELDRAAVTSVTVPADNPTLTFSTKFNIEQSWDFATVQVSTDGGKTYTSLANADTTSDHDPDAASNIVAQLPGFTGLQTEWKSESFDLSKYAGQTILLSFRYLTDAASEGNNGDPAGWWVDDVTVGGTTVSDGSSVADFKSATQVYPTPVSGWSLQLVGWDDHKKVYLGQVKLRHGAAYLWSHQLRKLLGNAKQVGVIVTVDDPSESATKNALYTLKVNGVTQPGGR
ncbi:immune inhibitor A domain-containing protein [Angustibacter sp. Root456]|uniref:immune inhibitor A domain-containing protein n=1 Tax=Angustibacter sp. Root456 TaxID=1736539 RepID=UPI00138ED28E|nr:immune inhibitor A domain-containing protein [Angustibacter sp. Root456]